MARHLHLHTLHYFLTATSSLSLRRGHPAHEKTEVLFFLVSVLPEKHLVCAIKPRPTRPWPALYTFGPREQVPAPDCAGKMTLPSDEESMGETAGLPKEKDLKGRLWGLSASIFQRSTRADQPFQLPDFCGQTEWSPVPGLPQLSHCGMETGQKSVLHEIHMVCPPPSQAWTLTLALFPSSAEPGHGGRPGSAGKLMDMQEMEEATSTSLPAKCKQEDGHNPPLPQNLLVLLHLY